MIPDVPEGADLPEIPDLPKITRYPLGALIKCDGREAWISGISHTSEPLYQLTFIEGQPEILDWVLHSRLTLIEKYPVSDTRLSKALRQYLNRKKSS
jgi:hypothetical protein